jgi:hypothetical protein
LIGNSVGNILADAASGNNSNNTNSFFIFLP